MPIIYRLIICLVVATPLSAVYKGYGDPSSYYVFDIVTALFFVVTAVLCVSLCSFGSPASSQSSGTNKSQSPQKDRKQSRKPNNKPRGKASAGREQGEVKWFNGGKGFGFITRENGEDIFVHFRSLQKNSRRLAPGLTVEFEVTEGEKGPEASDVLVLD